MKKIFNSHKKKSQKNEKKICGIKKAENDTVKSTSTSTSSGHWQKILVHHKKTPKEKRKKKKEKEKEKEKENQDRPSSVFSAAEKHKFVSKVR
jgi:hypothetical protein